MTSNPHSPTAKIYAFPTGGRRPASRQRESARTSSHFLQRAAFPEHGQKIVYGSSWYHQDAVDEADPKRSR